MSLRTLEKAVNRTADRTVGDVVATYGSNVQRLKMDTAAGKIDPTTALMAMMTIQRIIAANTQPPSGTTVAQDVGIASPPQPMGMSAMAPQAAPQQAPVGMAYGGQVAISNNQVPSPAMERGISGLPVPDNMFDYADGGMIAFAGGGDVQRFAPGGQPSLPSIYSTYQANASKFGPTTAATPSSGGFMDYLASYPERRQKEAMEELLKVKEALANPNLPGMARAELVTKLNSLQKELGGAAPPTRENTPVPEVLRDIGVNLAERRSELINSPETIAKALNQPKLDPIAASLERSKQEATKQTGASLPGVSFTKPKNEQDYLNFLRGPQSEFGEEKFSPTAFAEQATSRFAIPKELSLEDVVQRQKDIDEKMGVDKDFFKNMQGRLDTMREQAKTDKSEAANLRIIEAGLGILGGTSPYAFVNIGKGASEAVKGFGQDLKDYQKARRELDRAEMDLANAEQVYKRSRSDKALATLESRERDVVTAKNAAAQSFNSAYVAGQGIVEKRTQQEAAQREGAARLAQGDRQLSIQEQQLAATRASHKEAVDARREQNARQYGLDKASAIEKSIVAATKPIDTQIINLTKQLEDSTLGMAMPPEERKQKYSRLEKLYEEKDRIEREVGTRMQQEMGSGAKTPGLTLLGSRPANK
jgi:hypothetical protein